MKKYLLLLPAIFFIILQKSNAQTPVAYYPFSGNANDAVGTLNGTVNGATLTTDRFGNANSAYSFDGVNDFISTSTLATPQNENWTITAWIKPSPVNQNNGIVLLNGFGDNTGGNGYGIAIGDATNSVPGNLFKAVYPGVSYINSGFSFSTADTWYHVAIQQTNAGVLQFYLNGQLSATTSTLSINTAGGTFRIGSATGINFFSGIIDEVKVFNSTLTTQQIQNEFLQSTYSGQFNNNLQMNGVNDRINFTHPFSQQNFTIEMWVKPGATQVQYANLIDNSHNSFNNWVCQQNDNNINRYGFGINRTSGGSIGGDFTLIPNVWQHVALLKSSTALEVYVNGIVVLSLPWSGTINYSSPNISLCAVGSDGGRKWNGSMDEVRIWNTARTQAEIVSNMNTQLTGNEAGLVAYYDMNREGQGAGLTVENKASATGAVLNGTTIGTPNTPVFGPGVVQQKPGSGNAISFDGADDGIQVTHNAALIFSGDLTVETWVKIPAVQNNTTTGVNTILEKWNGNDGAIGYPFVLRYLRASHTVLFSRYNGTDGVTLSGTTVIDDNKWHHIAAQKNGTALSLFVDGVLQGTLTDLTNLSNVNNTQNLNIGTRGVFASQPCNLTGEIDEVRIWNTALTQAQIRDRMCHKITNADVLYSNLVAYYNFDEGTGSTAFDGTSNASYGTLTNAPARVTSGAAIGSASSHDYVNAAKTVSLFHATGESFTVTSSAGNPDGINVYRVDEQPGYLTGAIGVGLNNKYFGVFQAGGSSPQYTAVYNYTGNPGVTTGNESELRLNKRADNAAASWSLLSNTPNTSTNSITVNGESTEYILGKLGAVLPVNILLFTGARQNNDAVLNWKTNSEINISHFEIERSTDGQLYTSIGKVLPGTGNYSLKDEGIFNDKATVFYRLKPVGNDGRFNYSSVIRLTSNGGIGFTVFPNPTTDVINISGLQQWGKIQLLSLDGKILQQQTVTSQSITIDISSYTSGIYLLQYKLGKEIINQKIIKQ